MLMPALPTLVIVCPSSKCEPAKQRMERRSDYKVEGAPVKQQFSSNTLKIMVDDLQCFCYDSNERNLWRHEIIKAVGLSISKVYQSCLYESMFNVFPIYFKANWPLQFIKVNKVEFHRSIYCIYCLNELHKTPKYELHCCYGEK